MGVLTKQADRDIDKNGVILTDTACDLVELAESLEEALKWALERIEPQTAAIDQINEIKYKGLLDV